MSDNRTISIFCQYTVTQLATPCTRDWGIVRGRSLPRPPILTAWDNNLFGGNDGIVKHQPKHTAGILKHVENLPEKDIDNAIKQEYPEARVELFKKRERFTGTVKVILKDEDTLKRAIQNKIKINSQIYPVEVFNQKPKVIKCHRCQDLGHVIRLCHSDHPVCGKCSRNDHETKDCVIQEGSYKCAHCGGNHITGSYTCDRIKEKMDELLNRQYV